MGAWGNGIMQDDVAADVQIVFDNPPWPLDGPCQADDACTTYMALAALQLEHGSLRSDIREKAMEAATSEWAIDRWDEAGEDCIAARKEVLRQFTAILERGCCTPEELEQVTYPKEFALW